MTHLLSAVSELCQNPPFNRFNGLRLRAKQAPQVDENRNGRMDLMKLLEKVLLLHTQEVRGSSPCAPTTFNNLQYLACWPSRELCQNPSSEATVPKLEWLESSKPK
jgi:hypothetical protein